jgi:hypothetical protein
VKKRITKLADSQATKVKRFNVLLPLMGQLITSPAIAIVVVKI